MHFVSRLSLQSESSYLHTPGSVGFAHTGCWGRGADGSGGRDEGEASESERECGERGDKRR